MITEQSKLVVFDFVNTKISDYSYSYIEGILAKGKSTDWHIYFLRVIFSKLPSKREETLRTVDDKAVAFRIMGKRSLGQTFLLSANEKSNYYIQVNDINEEFKKISQLDIVTGLRFSSRESMNFQSAKFTGLENPNENIFLSVQEPDNIYDTARNLSRYQHLNGLGKNVLKIDLQKRNAFIRNVFIAFENNDGKIVSVSKSGSGISIYIDFDSSKKEEYELFLYSHDGIETELEVKEQVDYAYLKNPGFEIKLLKKGKLIDSYMDWEDDCYPYFSQQPQIEQESEKFILLIPESILKKYPEKIQEIILGASISYHYEVFDAAAILLRKVIESSIIIEAEKRGLQKEIRGKNNNYIQLSDLIKKIGKLFPEIDGKTTKGLDTVKIYGDKAAHVFDADIIKEDVDEAKVITRFFLEKLFRTTTLQE